MTSRVYHARLARDEQCMCMKANIRTSCLPKSLHPCGTRLVQSDWCHTPSGSARSLHASSAAKPLHKAKEVFLGSEDHLRLSVTSLQPADNALT